MYRPFNYRQIFEQAQPTAEPAQASPISGKNAGVLLSLSDADIDELSNLLESNSGLKLFVRPAQIVDRKDPSKVVSVPGFSGEANVALAIANSNEQNAQFPQVTGVDLAKTLVFNIYPKQVDLSQIESGPITVSLNLKAGDSSSAINVTFAKVHATEAQPSTQTTEPMSAEPMNTETPQTAATPEETALATGEMVGANPRMIKSFDDFVSESKKQWIKDVDMKKGALKKSLGKKELTASDINKEEAKLKKKDKDKKKPGLQLGDKDAKKQKRLVLAKNLMKASGAISESRQGRITGAKNDLVKLHEIIEKMIKQTTKK